MQLRHRHRPRLATLKNHYCVPWMQHTMASKLRHGHHRVSGRESPSFCTCQKKDDSHARSTRGQAPSPFYPRRTRDVTVPLQGGGKWACLLACDEAGGVVVEGISGPVECRHSFASVEVQEHAAGRCLRHFVAAFFAPACALMENESGRSSLFPEVNRGQ
jgi:hypothetical protein